MKKILFVAVGQSNWQGAATNEAGGAIARYRSRYTGLTDPIQGSNNTLQGGSCLPYLIDLAFERGVKLDVLNYAIGGASVRHYTGNLGGGVNGNPATPAANGYLSGGEYTSGNVSAPLVEGSAGFDPFGFMARTRAAMVTAMQLGRYDQVVGYWVNGEADAGLSATDYANYLVSITNYMLASGVQKHLIGLTCKPAAALSSDFTALQQGVAQAVAAQVAAKKPLFIGHDLFAKFGSNPPLRPETNGVFVHMVLRGQEIQARLAHAALIANGIY